MSGRRRSKLQCGNYAKKPDTSASSSILLQIDGNDPANTQPHQRLDDGEFIEVLHIPLNDMLARLNEIAGEGVVIDSRVYSYAIALAQATKHRPAIPELK